MTQPTQGAGAPAPDSDIARRLVFMAGYGIMEVVEDLFNHYAGRHWRPPADISEMVMAVDQMIGPLDRAILHARELILRSENPDDPDLEMLND